MTMAARRVRPPIAEIIEELKSWLPNYDHGEKEYPTVLLRILASAPGGQFGGPTARSAHAPLEHARTGRRPPPRRGR
jgi:hypothetical protein